MQSPGQCVDPRTWGLGSLGRLTVGVYVCAPPVVFLGVWRGAVPVCVCAMSLKRVHVRLASVCVRGVCPVRLLHATSVCAASLLCARGVRACGVYGCPRRSASVL